MNVRFCFTFINSRSSAWASIPLGVIGIVLLGFTIREMRKNINNLTLLIKLTYISIILSLLAFLTMIIVSQSFYWLLFTGAGYPQIFKSELVLYCIEVFSIYYGILLVPTNWMRANCLFFNDYALRYINNQQETHRLRNTIKFSQCCYRILVVYLVLRGMLLIGFIVSYAIVDNAICMDYYSFVIWVWCQAECVILLAVLLMGLASIYKNNTLKEILETHEYSLMKYHYLQLIVCMVLRLIFSGLTLFVLTGNAHVINLVLGSLVGLFLPVVVILRMYRLQIGQNQLTAEMNMTEIN